MFRKFLIFGVFLLTLPAHLSFATPALEANSLKVVLQRGTYSKATVSFTITNFVVPTDQSTYSMSDVTTEQAQLMLTRYLDVCVLKAAQAGTRCADGITLPKVQYLSNTNSDLTPEAQRTKDFGINFTSGSPVIITESADITGNTRRIEVTFDIIASGTKFSADTLIAIRLPLTNVSSPSQYIEDDEVAKLAVAATDVLDSVVINPSIGALTAVWEPTETLARDGDTAAVSDGATAFVVERDAWATIEIPMHTYSKASPESEKVEDGKCHIIAAGDDGCELECDGFDEGDGAHYLKEEDLTAAGIGFTSSGNTGSLSINNLKPEVSYAFVYQNQPDGLKRSCFVAAPSDAVTLTQLGGGPAPTARDPRCFIATAAYGSALDPHLDTLRWFRDNVLLVTRVGNKLVQTYYRYSPPLADFIAEHPTLRAIVRAALWAPVVMIETWRERPSLLLTLSAMSGTFFLLFLRRRSLRASV